MATHRAAARGLVPPACCPVGVGGASEVVARLPTEIQAVISCRAARRRGALVRHDYDRPTSIRRVSLVTCRSGALFAEQPGLKSAGRTGAHAVASEGNVDGMRQRARSHNTHNRQLEQGLWMPCRTTSPSIAPRAVLSLGALSGCPSRVLPLPVGHRFNRSPSNPVRPADSCAAVHVMSTPPPFELPLPFR